MNLKLVILNTSVVVLAKTHNPTILHPAFLYSQNIVPQDWKLAEQPVCTPAIALVKFANGISFTAETSKLQLMDSSPGGQSSLPELAVKYIEKLPHVRYTAVGINISGYAEREAPEEYLIRRFIRTGPWSTGDLDLKRVTLQFTYPMDQGMLNLKAEAGSVQKGDEQTSHSCLLISGNYHVDLANEHSLAEAKSMIGFYDQRLAHFDKVARTVFDLEEN